MSGLRYLIGWDVRDSGGMSLMDICRALTILVRRSLTKTRRTTYYVMKNNKNRTGVIPEKGIGNTDDTFPFACHDGDWPCQQCEE